MKEIKILYLYPDMLNLYGDRGNIQAIRYRAEKRGITGDDCGRERRGTALSFLQYGLCIYGG